MHDESSVTLQPITLICFGCGARFRLVPKGNRFPQGGVPCPKCKERISLPTHLRAKSKPPAAAPAATSTPEPPLTQPDVSAAGAREDEGGPDLLALLGGEANFPVPNDDAPDDDACGDFETQQHTGALPRRRIPGASSTIPSPGVDDGHLFALGTILALVCAVAALVTATSQHTPPAPAPVAPAPITEPVAVPDAPRQLEPPTVPLIPESEIRLRMDAGEEGLGPQLARTLAADESFRPTFPLLRARDQFSFLPEPSARRTTWRVVWDGPPAEFMPGAASAASAATSWRIAALLDCRVDIARARESLVPVDAVRSEGSTVVTGLGAFTVGAWVEPAADPPLPLSDRAVWTPWLRQGPPGALDQPAIEALAALDALEGGAKAREGLTAALGDRSARSLAASLSDTLVWVWLTGSESLLRDSDKRPAFGVGPAGISVLDLGAAFSGTGARIDRSPLRDVTRFRRGTLRVLRALDRASTQDALRPSGPLVAGQFEALFKLFWDRRQALLTHVDALVERHGADAVYYFD